jgi:hypothetical protein
MCTHTYIYIYIYIYIHIYIERESQREMTKALTSKPETNNGTLGLTKRKNK